MDLFPCRMSIWLFLPDKVDGSTPETWCELVFDTDQLVKCSVERGICAIRQQMSRGV